MKSGEFDIFLANSCEMQYPTPPIDNPVNYEILGIKDIETSDFSLLPRRRTAEEVYGSNYNQQLPNSIEELGTSTPQTVALTKPFQEVRQDLAENDRRKRISEIQKQLNRGDVTGGTRETLSAELHTITTWEAWHAKINYSGNTESSRKEFSKIQKAESRLKQLESWNEGDTKEARNLRQQILQSQAVIIREEVPGQPISAPTQSQIDSQNTEQLDGESTTYPNPLAKLIHFFGLT